MSAVARRALGQGGAAFAAAAAAAPSAAVSRAASASTSSRGGGGNSHGRSNGFPPRGRDGFQQDRGERTDDRFAGRGRGGHHASRGGHLHSHHGGQRFDNSMKNARGGKAENGGDHLVYHNPYQTEEHVEQMKQSKPPRARRPRENDELMLGSADDLTIQGKFKGEFAISEDSPVFRALTKLGLKEPTLIQDKAMPVINKLIMDCHRNPPCPKRLDMRRNSLILHSRTGSGKTYAFLAPILEQIIRHKRPGACSLHTVIVVPTESLGAQLKITADELIANMELSQFARTPKVASTFYGETALSGRERIRREAPDILITTAVNFLHTYAKFPGDEVPFIRSLESDASEFLEFDSLFQDLKCIVLDESDSVFIPASRYLGKITGALEVLQTLNNATDSVMNALLQMGDPVVIFSSATINSRFKKYLPMKGWSITNKIVSDQVIDIPMMQRRPVVHQLEQKSVDAEKDSEDVDEEADDESIENVAKNMSCPESIKHRFVYVDSRRSYATMITRAFLDLRNKEGNAQVLLLVPAEFEDIVSDTVSSLIRNRVKTANLDEVVNADPTRIHESMKNFLSSYKNKDIEVIVASPEKIHGIDLPDLKYVFLAPPPKSAASYVHCAGRTGRAGKSGVVVSFFMPSWFDRYEIMVSSLQVVANEMQVSRPNRNVRA
eukprot:TRINITY_DN1757_c0_g1_i1.p1 TRINITY_DN1757_c0_g1~~TRINITY_DN1757_c0_g1_i1.p1  ORF type:complete len:666 (-),score=163.00 TRINITY_DN1757_c0_g1_i1:66-2063(-)